MTGNEVVEFERPDLGQGLDPLAGWLPEPYGVGKTTTAVRQGLDSASATEAFRRLALLTESWHEIEPGEVSRETAFRFLRVHDLRAADSRQLTAAFWAAEGHPSALELVSLDDRLALAARREGFEVIDRPALG